MKYILTDNEILFTYDSEFEAYLKYIDLVTLKCNFLVELIKENNQLKIPNFMTLKLFNTYNSSTVDISYLDINELKFKNYINNTDIKFNNLSDDEIKIISRKLNLLNKTKFILDSYIVNQGIFIGKSNNTNNHITTYSNNTTSEVISNLNLDLESCNNSDNDSIIEESDIIDDSNNEDLDKEKEKNVQLLAQKERISKLLELKKQLEHNKKKKEKLEEILRRFKVDYDMYFIVKKQTDVPELFKYKYGVFKEMEDNNFISNINEAKKYYIKNFNRINKSIGSNIFTNVFNQKEAEESYEDISNNLEDSYESKNTLSSEEIEIS